MLSVEYRHITSNNFITNPGPKLFHEIVVFSKECYVIGWNKYVKEARWKDVFANKSHRNILCM